MTWRLTGWQSLSRLREAFADQRRERAASLRQIASETGISNVTLSEWERGKHDLPLSKAVKVARWMENR